MAKRISTSVEIVWSLNTSLEITFANRKVEEYIYRQTADIVDKQLVEVIPGIENSEFYKDLQRAAGGETVHIGQMNGLTRIDVVLETCMIPLRSSHNIIGVIVLQRDITALIQLTEKLKQTNLDLERSNHDLQQFAHAASHDLKEPVRKIRTFGNRLNEEFGELLPDKGRTYLQKMENAAKRMYSMIDGVLLYSSLNAMEQINEPIDLQRMFKQIEADLELMIDQKKALIIYKELPEPMGVPVLIYQLFYNLIKNSLKFSNPERNPLVTITGKNKMTDLKANKTFIEIELKDNGIGFSQKNASKIFQSFTRLNSKDRYEGTGLGLSLCKSIVERHGGSIEATANPDQGAVFVIRLPDLSKA